MAGSESQQCEKCGAKVRDLHPLGELFVCDVCKRAADKEEPDTTQVAHYPERPR